MALEFGNEKAKTGVKKVRDFGVKGGLLTGVFGVLILVVIGYWVNLLILRPVQDGEIKKLKVELNQLNEEIAELKKTQVALNQTSVAALKFIEESEVQWSKILGAVLEVAPKDVSGRESLVRFTSFNGTNDGKLTIGVVTRPSVVVPYQAVAQVLRTFNDSVFFKDAYTPTISKSNLPTGESTLSFTMNVIYLGDEEVAPVLGVPRVNTNNQ